MPFKNLSFPETECQALVELEKKVHNLEPVPFTQDFKQICEKLEASFMYEQGHVVGLYFQTEFLTSFPKSIENFTELRFIYLWGRIHSLPATFSRLEKLETFEFINPEGVIKIDFLEKFTSMRNLKTLRFNGAFTIYFPPAFTQLTNLEELCLEETCIYTTSLEVFKLKRKDIHERILPDLSNFQRLRRLFLHFGPSVIPAWISSLKGLRSLSISYAGFTHKIAFQEIGKLTHLEELALIQCGLEEIPGVIGEFTHLRKLDLSQNWDLKSMPEEIKQCSNLEELDLIGTNHHINLDFIFELPKIKHLDLVIKEPFFVPDKIKKCLEQNRLGTTTNP